MQTFGWVFFIIFFLLMALAIIVPQIEQRRNQSKDD